MNLPDSFGAIANKVCAMPADNGSRRSFITAMRTFWKWPQVHAEKKRGGT